MAWNVRYANGVYLPQLDWWLDARYPVERSFVSHAHFDHLARHREMLLTPGTAALLQARLPDASGTRIERALPFGESTPLDPEHPEVTVTLHPAGHIRGSAMILLAHPTHGRLLYTGDFKLRAGLSAEPCQPVLADVLVMETTYGRPHYTLPPTETVLTEVVAFCRAALEEGETPVLFGYSLGKSQEILTALARAALPIMLHPQTRRLTAVYESLGQRFPPHVPLTGTGAGHVVICPPQAADSAWMRKIPRRRTAMLTGWAMDPGARFRYQCDAAFALSDHADYPDLLRLVELTGARQVFTLHGFAADFARDLRSRGLEAWALTQPNQLELPLPPPAPEFCHQFGDKILGNKKTCLMERNPDCHQIGDNLGFAPSSREPADTLEGLACVAEAIRAEAGKSAKIRLLGAHLGRLPPEDAARAALYITGCAFPPTDTRPLNLGGALVRRAVLTVSGHNEGDFRQAYRRFGDTGETAEALLAAAAHRPAPPAFTLTHLAALFVGIAATPAPATKNEILVAALHHLSPQAAKYLIKIITGDLRIGLREGLIEEAVAEAAGQPLDAIREAVLRCGDLAAVVRAAFADTLDHLRQRVFQPVRFMLASPEPTAAAVLGRLGAPVWLEDKYDGIRCQLHKQGTRVELFSRELRCITGQFPELARAAAQELDADCILDGELLAWRDGRALPFQELQKRLNRRLAGDDFFLGQEIPVGFSAYDLLWIGGRSLLEAPLRERRIALESLLSPQSPSAGDSSRRLRLAPCTRASTVGEIEHALQLARQSGNEGLMAKDPASGYTPGRRGLAWLKLKKSHATLDVVVVAVAPGHGKRSGLLSDYTFAVRDETTGELRILGKAYTGLTDAELTVLTEHFTGTTIELCGRTRRVHPDTVLEIAFDQIQPSERHDSGLALRFPRIVRLRSDKSLADIDTLATCRRLTSTVSAKPPRSHPD